MLALEVASGSGGQLEEFAPAFPHITWQPSEFIQGLAVEDVADATAAGIPTLRAIDFCCEGFGNVKPAVPLDARWPFEHWPSSIVAQEGSFSLVYVSNVFHISAWTVGVGILEGASRCLTEGGLFIAYGPFKVDGKCTTPSNEDFDASLRSRNPEWGYRDIQELADVGDRLGLVLRERRPMPANNFLLSFERLPRQEVSAA